MKNIHVLPTDKPFRLKQNKITKKYSLVTKGVDLTMYTPQNIYITSDEEIKDVRPYEGKWQLEKGHILNQFPDYLTDLSECKLVIMTTDQDLIKDGVQAIDDEFLEWFVKNPSCDMVEVVFDNRGITGTEKILKTFGDYKIIIPKEEAKEEMPQIGTKEFNDLASAYFGGKPKQETLEEAAENSTLCPITKMAFIYGAEWQAKKMYSEEDMMESFIEGYKQRAEKSDLIFDNASRMYAIALFEQFKN